MAETPDNETDNLMTLSKLIEHIGCLSADQKPPCSPPAIPVTLQLKWAITLLGEERAAQYLTWLRDKVKDTQ